MKLWPFNNKKPKIHKTEWKTEPYTITLDSNDTPKERAIKMCQVAGLVINRNMYERLEGIEKVFEFYQKNDYKLGKKSRILKKESD